MLAQTQYPDVRDTHPAERAATVPGWPLMSRRHALLFGLTALVYLVVVVLVVCDSELVEWDWALELARPYKRWPELLPMLNVWVIAGQRGPSAIVASIWLAWRAFRTRTMRPLLVMGAALLLLNVTVGGVKIVTGRLGPHYAHYVGSPELFSGGNIFPSGHTANAVVTWGVLAYLAVRWRRPGAVLAGLTAVSIGLTTIYLGTHWFSDVLAGWAAGALVLLALPLFEPLIDTTNDWITARWRPAAQGAPPGPGAVTAVMELPEMAGRSLEG